MREFKYRHPEIDHTFIIKVINISEFEIDGIRLSRKNCEWMEMMANDGSSSEVTTINDLSLPMLQSILLLKHKT